MRTKETDRILSLGRMANLVAIPEMKCSVSLITTPHTVSCNFIILKSYLHNSYPYYERKTQIRQKRGAVLEQYVFEQSKLVS